ncbi:MAG: ATP-binding protein [Desulfomonilaceae bacterium]|nr:ATP-binding protein [Desulfomonilaceae bacterium]
MDRRLSVLIADDEPIIRHRVCMMIGNAFCVDEVDRAETARQASADGYDAIVLDIVFPDGNGIDICREIKQRDPYCTVVISSSMESVDAWNDAFRAGADGYLEKRELLNLDPRKIVLMIENLVERNRLKRRTEELTKRQAELLSILSHDVRAPFQVLLGTIELLRKGQMPPDVADKVETLHRCAGDQLAFINSLLEFLRLESGMAGLRRIAVDMNLPVNQTLQGLRVLAEQKSISLEARLEDELPEVFADLARISQLIHNLVTNAIKFTQPGGSIVVTSRRTAYSGMEGVELAVADTGIGIKPEDRERVFQRFGRSTAEGTQGERGTGLGLSICREIVQLHGGTLWIDDGATGGTTMRAWFPVMTAPESDECRTVGCAHIDPRPRAATG